MELEARFLTTVDKGHDVAAMELVKFLPIPVLDQPTSNTTQGAEVHMDLRFDPLRWPVYHPHTGMVIKSFSQPIL